MPHPVAVPADRTVRWFENAARTCIARIRVAVQKPEERAFKLRYAVFILNPAELELMKSAFENYVSGWWGPHSNPLSTVHGLGRLSRPFIIPHTYGKDELEYIGFAKLASYPGKPPDSLVELGFHSPAIDRLRQRINHEDVLLINYREDPLAKLRKPRLASPRKK